MRCVVGFTLFCVLYFGSCKALGIVAGLRGAPNSKSAQQAIGARVVTKYHALVAVGAGAVALGACCVPSLLVKLNGRNEWEQLADEEHGGRRASST